ncbi:class I SAM-dependent methyltransferase [Dictyobacter formicarum]|uniref:class I SAM-dependent methyltransferase n=1 Tax=Dictyobacter formicarum TaxID=2778368 RepID=UPI0019164D8B|nr:class I SAM-dependent methyltransferase [Dictyobacter formicarum]
MFTEAQTLDAVIEIARLTNKLPLLIHCLGGVLPGMPGGNLSDFSHVLELCCGPGGWMQEFARAYKKTRVTGVDTREIMVEYAANRMQAYSNAKAVLVPSYTNLSCFNDAAFDVVTIQFLSSHINIDQWESVLKECKRVLKSGGLVRITESEFPHSNSPALETWSNLCWQGLIRIAPYSFSSHRRQVWLCELEPSLVAAGFESLALRPHLINFSYGASYYEEWKHDLLIQAHMYLPAMIASNLIHQDQGTLLLAQLQQEMNLPTFHAIQYLATAWGRKG